MAKIVKKERAQSSTGASRTMHPTRLIAMNDHRRSAAFQLECNQITNTSKMDLSLSLYIQRVCGCVYELWCDLVRVCVWNDFATSYAAPMRVYELAEKYSGIQCQNNGSGYGISIYHTQ